MLAAAIRKSAPADWTLLLYDLPSFDLTDRVQVFQLQGLKPDVIINCAACTNVDGCEEQENLAMQVNGYGPGLLAELARQIDAVLMHISTDFVFDGRKTSPYVEGDPTNPLSVYGKSKLLGEQQILKSGLQKYFIVRTSWLYGQHGNNFVETIIRLAKERTDLKIISDQKGTPTLTDDLAEAVFTLLQTNAYGIYHYSNEGQCSWFEFASEIVTLARKRFSLKIEQVLPIPTEGYPLPAVRPKYSVFSKQKIKLAAGINIPDWRDSLAFYLAQRK